jgi:RHS repeat-associated protein
MKTNILIIVLFILTTVNVFSQSSDRNYTVTTVPRIEVSDATTLGLSNSNIIIQYIDGLGRPVETVQRGITPTGADLVNGIVYDAYGRESQRWLPGAVSGNSGAFVSSFASASQTTNGDNQPYTTTEYEPSPLNRVTGQYGAGQAWYNAGKKQVVDYQTNDASIAYYYVNTSGNLQRGSNYATNTLFIIKSTDEDGKFAYEYKDKLGQVVLKRQILDGNNVDTYYVYNDLGQLSYVLPPLGADGLTAFSVYSDDNTILKKYAYLYKYDERGNCIAKRLPGCEWIYMVYDRADRLILSQDGNQRAKTPVQWTVTKYDQLGRVIFTGQTGSITANHASLINTYKTDLIVETFSNGAYSTNKFADAIPLTINYYDDYSFITDGTLNYDSSKEQNGYTAKHSSAKGLLTGTRVYHLDNPALYETSALYYDKYGRVVQSRASNHLGGYDLVYNELKFTGVPARTLKTHSINGTTISVTELYTYNYDHAQRPTTTTYSLNGGSTVTLASNTYDELGRLQTKTLGGVDATTYTYNVRSWTTAISGSRFSENLYYNANTINLPNFTPAYNGNIAGMKWNVPDEYLGYDRAYTFTYDGLNRLLAANYTGFTSSVVSGTQSRYDEYFWFDKMGNSTYFVRNGLLTSSGNYGPIDILRFTYNGNQKVKITDAITNVYGLFYGDEEFVQNTSNSGNSCAYDANGNRLYDSNSNIWGIRYNVLNLPEAMQFYQGHQTNYTYSASGEKLKVIDKTAPDGVALPVTSLNTILTNPSVSTTTTTDYVGNIIYENGTLKRILTPVGYWQGGTYYYFLKDHLGSNRVVITGSGAVVETSSYYPSGMRFGESAVYGGSVQPYRHTGHEMQQMHGLNWIDNLARFRTVSDGSGFTGVDPLAEKYYSMSPYAYCMNNPIKYLDPLGLDTFNVNIDNHTINRIPVENSKVHTYVMQNDDGTLTTYNLNINDNGQVLFPESGFGFDRYGPVDENGDHYLTPEAAAATLGLVTEVALSEYTNAKISFGDMSDSNGSAPGGNHASHGGKNGGSGSGVCIDYRYINENFKSKQGTAESSWFNAQSNKVFLDYAKDWGFTRNYISPQNGVWGNQRVNGKPLKHHENHGHLTYTGIKK